MSIILKDGTVLPDLPEGLITEEYPYAVIGKLNTDEFTFCLACVCSKPFFYAPKELFEANMIVSDADTAKIANFSPDNMGDVWYNENTGDSGFLLDGEEGYAYTLEWTNHDIYQITGFDENENPIIGTEPYFPNSLAQPKPPFILPDGTELPALPDGCFDRTPYGAVILLEGTYHALMVTQSPSFVADIGDGTDGMFLPVGNYSIWAVIDGAWQGMVSTENQEPYSIGTFADTVIFWSNYDILTATANDDGSYTIGTEIARKSDENYRVTGGYMTSIANEARRLGGVAGEMKPDVLESTLRGVTGGGNLPNAEDMVFGSDGSSSEYGIFLKDDSPISTSSNNGTMGWAFTVLDDIVVKGLRYYSPGNAIDKSRIVRLWSGDGREVLVEYSAPNDSITDPSGWVEHVLETPLTLEAGKTYNLSVYSTVRIARTAVENVTLNPKIQYVRYWFVDNEHMFDFGSSDYKDTVVLCDFVADTDDAGENVNQPCIIQSDTVDDIADEAKRIVGKSGKISPAQIVSALKSVTAGGGDGPQLAPNERIYQLEATISAYKVSWETSAVGSLS